MTEKRIGIKTVSGKEDTAKEMEREGLVGLEISFERKETAGTQKRGQP